MSEEQAAYKTGHDVIELQPQNQQALTPMDMLNAAVARGDNLDKLEKLMDLNDRWEAAQAKKAYTEAKAEFKANAPAIIKDMENKQYGSKYSSIGNVVNTMNAALAPYGLDANWDVEQTETTITVICILTHRQGHSERVSITSSPDNSGSKNPIQQLKSAMTYLKLATFEAVVGVASKEGNKDDDGNAAGAKPISEDELNELLAAADEVSLDKAGFCKWLGVSSFAEIPHSKLNKARAGIAAKKKQKEAGNADH